MADYPAQPANPKGEVHEHWSSLSYDKIRQTVVLRQFHVEGFVNTYRLLPRNGTDKRLVFESDQIENLPADWKARETYEQISQDEFTETFELASPGKPFEVYGKARRRDDQLELFAAVRRSLPVAHGNPWVTLWLRFGRRGLRGQQDPERGARRTVFHLAPTIASRWSLNSWGAARVGATCCARL